MNTTITLSKKGLKELKKEISSLEKSLSKTRYKLKNMDKDTSREGRLDRVDVLSRYDSIEQELFEKRLLLKNVKLLPKKRNQVRVAIGSAVELIDRQGKKLKFTLVESVEANPSDGRLSIKSPLGMELIGKTIKDTISYATSNGHQQFKLIAIR